MFIMGILPAGSYGREGTEGRCWTTRCTGRATQSMRRGWGLELVLADSPTNIICFRGSRVDPEPWAGTDPQDPGWVPVVPHSLITVSESSRIKT